MKDQAKSYLFYKTLSDLAYEEGKSGFLVIYKDGSLTGDEQSRMRHQRVYPYSDREPLRMKICGLQICGLIIQEGATVSEENLRYLTSRFRCHHKKYFFISDQHHREVFKEILQSIYENAEDKETVEKFISYFAYTDEDTLCALVLGE